MSICSITSAGVAVCRAAVAANGYRLTQSRSIGAKP
jgi:hypothetical protein